MKKLALVLVCGGIVSGVWAQAPQGGKKPVAGRPSAIQAIHGNQKPAAQAKPKQGAASRGNRRPGTVQRMHREDPMVTAIERCDSLEGLRHMMPKVLHNPHAEVRQVMVDALEDKGRRAVNDVAVFLMDGDEDVADAAWSAWTNMVEDMSPRGRAAAIQGAAQTLQSFFPAHPAPAPVGPVVH